jgi:hypothetical protein
MGLFGLRTFILCKKIHMLATGEGKHDMIRKEWETVWLRFYLTAKLILLTIKEFPS